MLSYEVLQFIWWILLIVLLSGFAILDGFDLGALAINPFISKTDSERRVVINTIAPHWDGNQVWLLLGGGAIFAAYPVLYGVSFSGLFLGMILVLSALFFRPVGLEYRHKFELEGHRRMIDWTLFISGFVPPLVVGVALGNALQGFPVTFNDFGHSFYSDINLYGESETWFLWKLLVLLNPLALVTGLLTTCVFLLQGSNWVKLRVTLDSALHARTTALSKVLTLLVLVLAAVVTIWLCFIPGYKLEGNTDIILANNAGAVVVTEAGGWFHNFNANPVLYALPVLAFLSYALSYVKSASGKDACAFIASSVGVILLFATFAVSLFPFVFPSSIAPEYSLTIWNSSASQFTLNVMFWVAIVITPVVLVYTAWCYYKLWERLSADKVEENSHSLY